MRRMRRVGYARGVLAAICCLWWLAACDKGGEDLQDAGGMDAGGDAAEPLCPESPTTGKSGEVAWAISAGGSGGDSVADMAVQSDGSIFIVGDFYREATFGAGEKNETTLKAPGVIGMYVAKYAPCGKLEWALMPEEEKIVTGRAIAAPQVPRCQ